jgi:hypothetical protein
LHIHIPTLAGTSEISFCIGNAPASFGFRSEFILMAESVGMVNKIWQLPVSWIPYMHHQQYF